MDTNPIVEWLDQHCRASPIDEKWLLVEHMRVGQQWKDRLARSGCWHINLHAKTCKLIVDELVAPWLAERGWVAVGRSGLELLIGRVVQTAINDQRLAYFQVNAAAQPALTRLLLRTYNDWRLSGLPLDALTTAAMEVPAKAADLRWIFQAIDQQLAASRQVDYAGRILAVTAALKEPRFRAPRGLQILQPEDFPMTRLERELLAGLHELGCAWHTPAAKSEGPRAQREQIDLLKLEAVGEINEVRGVFQQCVALSNGAVPLDTIEVLVTDYEHYAALILEGMWQWLSEPTLTDANAVKIDQLPVTFAEGIPCIYSRPGRLLRSWIRWLEGDHLQSKAVQIVREGLLVRPSAASEVGYARLANTLRRIPIGFGIDRYLPQIEATLATAQRDAARAAEHDGESARDHGVPALEALLCTVRPLIELAPATDAAPIDLLVAARQLLASHVRAENAIDRYARAKLLEDIDGMVALAREQPETPVNIRAWLEELPERSRLLASTPRPGCVHVASLDQGGASGRPRVFVLGMDDRRFPRGKPIDPILLDAERQRVSADLPTSEQLAQYQQSAIDRVLRRLQGIEGAQIVFAYTLRSVLDDSECYPSPLIERLGVDDLATSTVSFVADKPQATLTAGEGFLRGLLLEPSAQQRQQHLVETCARVSQQRLALEQHASPIYGAYDGWVPQAGIDLLAGATARPMSPSGLETLGSCPRKYFFSRALKVVPPGQCDVDPDQWLTPHDLGTLLHNLFEEFLRELQAAHETPDPARHGLRLQELLAARITREIQHVPIHNEEAFRRQQAELAEYCEIFLEKECQYAQQRRAKPWILEASLGSLQHSQPHAKTEIDCDQPIVIELKGGHQLHLCGRIDRIDRLEDAGQAGYLIWDYKTGSAFGFDRADPLREGRKLQPLLYVRMLAARLAQLGLPPEAVQGFGYFFPGPRAEGLRHEWSVAELSVGDAVLEAMLDLLSAGTFIATNSQDDCQYCDYQRVCGAPHALVALSNLKTIQPENTQLEAWRRIRGKE